MLNSWELLCFVIRQNMRDLDHYFNHVAPKHYLSQESIQLDIVESDPSLFAKLIEPSEAVQRKAIHRDPNLFVLIKRKFKIVLLSFS